MMVRGTYHQHQPPPTQPLKRTWWVVPYISGVLVVLAAAGLFSVLHHGPAKAGTAAETSSPTPTEPMPAQMVADPLFKQLTKDLQTQNEQGFLSLVAPDVRPAVRTWWYNLQAIGYSTGVFMPAGSNSVVDLTKDGNGTITVLAGTHSPLDPVDGSGQPDVPCERYLIGLHFASPTAIGQITSWRPLGDAPWDQGVQLYVRKAANVVVAGPPSDSALVDQTLPLAQTAASYDIGVVDHVHYQDLRQEGFVVFVSGSSAVRGQWFSAGPQPQDWPPEFLGARTVPLPGADGDGTGIVSGVSNGTTGGARVVITPYQDEGGTPHSETVQFVRLFMLDILASYDEELINGIALLPTPEWAVQGLGVAMQGLYAGNTNPTPDKYDFSVLTSALRSLPASYRRGHLPTAKQLFTGPVTSQEDWNVVAASVYEYIELKHGMNQMLASAVLLYTRGPTPFTDVLAASSGQTYTFYTTTYIEDHWRAWLASL
jgi:hypothetical protein